MIMIDLIEGELGLIGEIRDITTDTEVKNMLNREIYFLKTVHHYLLNPHEEIKPFYNKGVIVTIVNDPKDY